MEQYLLRLNEWKIGSFEDKKIVKVENDDKNLRLCPDLKEKKKDEKRKINAKTSNDLQHQALKSHRTKCWRYGEIERKGKNGKKGGKIDKNGEVT